MTTETARPLRVVSLAASSASRVEILDLISASCFLRSSSWFFLSAPSPLPPQEEANSQQPIANSVTSASDKLFVQIYPNPNDGNMQVSYLIPEGMQTGTFVIFDVAGKEVYSQKLNGGKNAFEISDVNFNKGVYYYQLISDETRVQGKLVIIK